MPLATFKDLCVDAVDPVVVGRFWASVLGLRLVVLDDGDARLDGPTPHHRVWVNGVPEPVSAKQRVHLDVHARSTADVLGLGATALDTASHRWDVLRDPEGGELCVFAREEVPAYRLYELGVDSRDPVAQAAWWQAAWGGELGRDDDEGWAWVESIPSAPFDSVVFAPVPEPKTVKNRIHWDVDTPDVQRLVEHGATVLRERDDQIGWTVLADPEGNEFCAFTPQD